MSNTKSSDVAIFWDLENVQPSGETFLIDELKEYALQFGRIVIARSFADFHKYDPKIAQDLTSAQFELIHLPHNEFQKNSIDILLAVNATNTLVLYPNIEHYVIVSGDYDFRGLVQTLQMHGKKVHMVCDPINTRTELLRLVDDYQDIYELSELAVERHPSLRSDENVMQEVLMKLSSFLDGQQIITPEKQNKDQIKQRAKEILKTKQVEQEKLRDKVNNIISVEDREEKDDTRQRIELALDKLQEAIGQSCEELNQNQADHNHVLTRLKVLYPDLEEDMEDIGPELGIDPNKKWYANFLKYAEKRGKININLDGATYYLSTDRIGESETKKRTRLYFENIQEAIRKYGENKKINISRLAQVINDNYDIDYNDLGYKNFKASLIDAQKKDLINLKRSKQNMSWVVKLIN